jgi:hypothetical protein
VPYAVSVDRRHAQETELLTRLVEDAVKSLNLLMLANSKIEDAERRSQAVIGTNLPVVFHAGKVCRGQQRSLATKRERRTETAASRLQTVRSGHGSGNGSPKARQSIGVRTLSLRWLWDNRLGPCGTPSPSASMTCRRHSLSCPGTVLLR